MIDQVRNYLSGLSRPTKRSIQLLFDFVALALVAVASYMLRLGVSFTPSLLQIGFVVLAPLVAIPVFIRLGLYRAILRYLPEKASWTIVKAMSLATLLWVMLIFLTEMSGLQGVPRSIPVIYWALGIIVVGGSRFAAKSFFLPLVRDLPNSRRALVYGAGRAGIQLANALTMTGGDPAVIGFLDDKLALRGHDVAGFRVFDPAKLEDLIQTLKITDVILCMPSAGANRRLQIAAGLARLPVKISTLPSITEIAAGKYSIGALKNIEIEDLLGRTPVAPDPELIRSVVAGKCVAVTGAGGSIGSELCRLVARNGPTEIVLIESSEAALFEIDRTLRRDMPGLVTSPVLGSVTDAGCAEAVFEGRRVDVLFHAAAHKHVPLLERNLLEAVRNNVFGTFRTCRAAFDHGVQRFVLISTDKAVRPVSVMGATKWWSEQIVRHFAALAKNCDTGQKFMAVRFGNVLGSSGSVVPLFKEQIARGGPVTLTDARMTRYFMAVPEAAELIIQAAALSDGGEIFVLDMGEPISIHSLAENMIRLAGLTVRTPQNPSGDIEIELINPRPGEKLHEALFAAPALLRPTRHPKIRCVQLRGTTGDDLVASIRDLQAAIRACDALKVRELVFGPISAEMQVTDEPAVAAVTVPPPASAQTEKSSAWQR